MSNTKYTSDINLGERYRDTQTGLEGIATAIYFYQYGCERVSLEFLAEGKLQHEAFDAPRLQHAVTGKVAKVTRTGGPHRGASADRLDGTR